MDLNYDKLKQELEDTKHVNNAPERERIIAKISATALVDIAETLGQLLQVGAVESAIVTLDNLVDDSPPEPTPDERPLEVGDLVALVGIDEQNYATLKGITESEGNLAALIEWSDESTAKVWLDELVRVEPFDDPDPADLEGHERRVDAFANLVASRKGGNRA